MSRRVYLLDDPKREGEQQEEGTLPDIETLDDETEGDEEELDFDEDDDEEFEDEDDDDVE